MREGVDRCLLHDGPTSRADSTRGSDEADGAADASRTAVVEAFETVSRRNLVSEGDDDSEGDPAVADDRVVALGDHDWSERVAAEPDADEATVETVREIRARQADALLRLTGADRGRFADRTPVVIQFGRRAESDAPSETVGAGRASAGVGLHATVRALARSRGGASTARDRRHRSGRGSDPDRRSQTRP